MNCPECGYSDDTRDLSFCPKCGHALFMDTKSPALPRAIQPTIYRGGQMNESGKTNELYFANQLAEIKRLAEEQRNDVHTIKNIAVFYLVLSILGISVYALVVLLALIAS
jgi:hypothetical protein